jgi:iron(III) transport system substrate-binding protein
VALACFASSLPALAAANAPVTTAVTGQIAGADRMERLIAGAKREGVVSVYSSTAVEDMTPLVAAFERKYGIRVQAAHRATYCSAR